MGAQKSSRARRDNSLQQRLLEGRQDLQHLIDICLGVSGVDLETDGLVAARDNREGQTDRQNSMIKKILNEAVRFGGVPNQQRNDRVGPRDGLQAKSSDALAKLMNSLLDILQSLETFGAVA
jgi:hypothetical protein